MYRLGTQSLWVDEIMSLQSAAPGSPLHLSLLIENYHGPLHAIVLHAWTAIAGVSETALRWPSVLASLATVPVVYLLARTLFTASTGVLAAALTAVSPFQVWYAQECRNYAFAIFFSALLLWATARIILEDGRARAWTLFAIAGACGVWSNLFVAFVVLACTASVLLCRPRALVSRGAALAHAVVVVAAVLLSPAVWGWLDVGRLAGTAPAPALRGETTLPALAVPYAFYAYLTGYSLGPSLQDLKVQPGWSALLPWMWVIVPAAIAWAVLLAGGALSAAASRPHRTMMAVWVVLPLLCVVFLAWRNVKVFNPRYAAAVSVPLLVLAARGVQRLPRAAALVASGVAVACCALALVHHYADPRYAKEDLRTAAHVLEHEARPGDAILVEVIHLPLTYYYHGAIPYTVVYAEERTPARVAQVVARATDGAARAWVVSYPHVRVSAHGELQDAMAAWGTVSRRVRFAGGDILLYRRHA